MLIIMYHMTSANQIKPLVNLDLGNIKKAQEKNHTKSNKTIKLNYNLKSSIFTVSSGA